mgnify:CR=1 FL=1
MILWIWKMLYFLICKCRSFSFSWKKDMLHCKSNPMLQDNWSLINHSNWGRVWIIVWYQNIKLWLAKLQMNWLFDPWTLLICILKIVFKKVLNIITWEKYENITNLFCYNYVNRHRSCVAGTDSSNESA